MSELWIELRDVHVHFPLRGRPGALLRAVDGVSLGIERGEALGLVGESGCGKSTTARVLAGLQRPTKGSVHIEGRDATRRCAADRARVAIVFQDPFGSLDPKFTVEQSLVEPLAIQRACKPRERRLRALAALEACGLEALYARRLPHELSGGQRQRVAIARALVLEPQLLVCDEPTSALDVSVRAQVVELLRELRTRFGLSILMVSHDLAIVRHLCERVAVMYLGRVVESSPREQLFARPLHPYAQALLDALPRGDPLAPHRPAPLSGEPGSAANLPQGCAFHPRCPRRGEVAGERCLSERPALEARGSSLVACHLR